MATVPEQIQQITERKAAIIADALDGIPPQVATLLDDYKVLLARWLSEGNALTLGELGSLAAFEDLTEILRLAGLDNLVATIETTLASVQPLIVAQAEAAGLTVSVTTLDVGALEALTAHRVAAVSEAIARPLVSEIQAAWVDATFLGETVEAAIEAAVANVPPNVVASQARTEIGTAIRSIDRAVTTKVADSVADDTVYLYVGPSPGAGDRVTRASCRHIVDTYATRAQIDRLDNGQLPNVLLTGGGYNCRHSWAPMLYAVAENIGLDAMTDQHIARFNAGAYRKKTP